MDLEVEKDEQVTRWWKEKFQFSKNKSIYKWINSKLEEFPNFLSLRKCSKISYWRKIKDFCIQNGLEVSKFSLGNFVFQPMGISLFDPLLFSATFFGNIFIYEFFNWMILIKLSITIDFILSLLIGLAEWKSLHTDWIMLKSWLI